MLEYKKNFCGLGATILTETLSLKMKCVSGRAPIQGEMDIPKARAVGKQKIGYDFSYAYKKGC